MSARDRGAPPPPVSVLLATYEQPAWLEKVLWGWEEQTFRDFELLVADDGSGPATREVVRRSAVRGRLRVRHVWHEDLGHRKCVILNRAVVASEGEYLVFSDGDCIPRRDFLETHVRLRRPGSFLSGGAVKLPLEVSEALTEEDVRAGRATDPGWLRSRGFHPGRHRLRFLRSGAVPRLLDALTPTGATWNGGNASTWREAVLAVNGFEAEMGYGGQDRAFGERLENAGFRGRQIRYRAVLVHLEHDRPYRTEASLRRNRQIRERIRRNGEIRAREGIAELPDAHDAAPARRGGQED